MLAIPANALPAGKSPADKSNEEPETSFGARLEAGEADVLLAVREVSADQIIHGTFSYDKERILYGAHAAESSAAFRGSAAGVKVFYKVAEGILAPRYFKDSGDIGTITVRYVVQAAGPNATNIQVAAVFIDARRRTHASEGAVEAAEYAAIKEHLQAIALKKQQAEQEAQELAHQNQQREEKKHKAANTELSSLSSSAPAGDSAKDLQAQVDQLRRQVIFRVKDAATPLKSAPFKSASNVQLLTAHTEVVVLILSPYWYGVEIEDGRRGWIQRSQLEPLP